MKLFWTEEKLEWLRCNATRDRHNLIKMFNKKFKAKITMSALKSTIRRFNLDIPSPRVHWTEDKLEFLLSNSFNTKQELLKAFNDKYKSSIKISQLTHIAFLHKIPLPDKERTFKPQGSIMHTKHGIPLVKIKNRVYQSKHRYLYEQYHNVKLNDNDMIVFLDNDKTNFSKDNLYRITKSINCTMKCLDLHHTKSVDKLTIIKVCEWKQKIKGDKK